MAKLGYAQRIKSRIQYLESVVERAQAELDELRVAERVIGRLSNEDEVSELEVAPVGISVTREGTVTDMVIRCLKEIGPSGTVSILNYLREHWRADLKHTTLASTLSRAKHEGKIVVVNGQWNIPSITKEPPFGGSKEIDFDEMPSEVDDDARSVV
jgi:hypothetical protein